MKPNVRKRAFQAALTLGALLVVILTALPGTASLAATPHANTAASASSSSLLRAAVAQANLAAAGFAVPPSSQFDILGFLDAATLDPSCQADAHCGGTLVVNGQTVVVPKETIALLPANALTWQELFDQAPAPYGLGATPPATGMALADTPTPLTTFEAHVVGNRVGDQYIAGLIYLSQQSANGGAGYINYMDYASGEMRVGGTLGDPNSGARVQINDPVGRFGRVMTPDKRFTVDADNPTITSATGFPMCFPRTDPAAADDPECPQANRPIEVAGNPPTYALQIQTFHPQLQPNLFPNATKQAPFEVGDYITYAGTRFVDDKGIYISAHTITANLAIFTWPGTNPAYVLPDVTILGTGGTSIIGATEAAHRSRIEGMTTDPTRAVRVFGIDFDAATGAPSDRFWGRVLVDPGAPIGAQRGRWRFRPRASFVPATREIRAVIEGAWRPGQTTTYANGIIAGQYHAPVLEYLFPEARVGNQIVPNNFETMDFLVDGGYSSSAGTIAKRLNPWPGAGTPPSNLCEAPIADTGGPYIMAAGGVATLNGSATGTLPITYKWTTAAGSLSNATIATPVYRAAATVEVVPISVTATNACGASTSTSTVTVNAPVTPTINPIAPQTVFSGQSGVTLVATGSPDLTFTWKQTSGPAVLTTPTVTGDTVSFTAPTLPLDQVTSTVLSFQVTAQNTLGQTSAPVQATVTVVPAPDGITVTVAAYRATGQRLDLTAISTVASANVILKLQPYLTTAGTMYDPTKLGNTFTSTSPGLYTLTLIGAPEPAEPPATPIVVMSNHNGVSAPTALTLIRP